MNNEVITEMPEYIKIIKNLISLVVAVSTAILTLRGNIETLFQEPFEIKNCYEDTETHTGIEYSLYTVTTEPPLQLAKLCVQPYILIKYKKTTQIILLENLYTQNAFKSENGIFPLLKRKNDADFYTKLKKELETEIKSKSMNIKNLTIENDTILCFAYSEMPQPGKYYLLNSLLPKKISRYSALKILNANCSTNKVDMSNFNLEGDEFKALIQTILINIPDYESSNPKTN